MDGNKDEANRCIDIAIDAASSGDFQRAEKFLRKADNLFPTPKAKELLARMRANQSSPKMGPRKRTAHLNESNSTSNKPAHTEEDYTIEQMELCKRIRRCKDYYEVLNVTKEATDTEIKKSYKKLALQLHPDKNHAPGAVEAFKTLGHAAGILTDSEKRKNYDLHGGDMSKMHSNRHHYHANHEYEHAYRGAGSGFESDFTAEELFNMFFGNGFAQTSRSPTGRRYPTRHESAQYQYHHHQQQPSLAFGIILVLVLISMMASFFTSDPVYSLAQSHKYPLQRKTVHLNIPYFVRDQFQKEYQGSMARLENAVEEEYIAVMKQNCYRERSYREIMMARARNFGNELQLEHAKLLKVTSCENLARIGLTKFMPN